MNEYLSLLSHWGLSTDHSSGEIFLKDSGPIKSSDHMLTRCYDLYPLGTVLGMIFIELLHLAISTDIFGAI